MPRRPPVGLVLAGVVTAGCGSGPSAPVDLPAVPGVVGAALQSCRGLSARLPKTLLQGQARRTVRPDSPTTAAWGEPPLLLRCGVGAGRERDPMYEFNAVRWRLREASGSRTWTTEGLRVNVSVQIPDAYSSQAELLGSLAPQLQALR